MIGQSKQAGCVPISSKRRVVSLLGSQQGAGKIHDFLRRSAERSREGGPGDRFGKAFLLTESLDGAASDIVRGWVIQGPEGRSPFFRHSDRRGKSAYLAVHPFTGGEAGTGLSGLRNSSPA